MLLQKPTPLEFKRQPCTDVSNRAYIVRVLCRTVTNRVGNVPGMLQTPLEDLHSQEVLRPTTKDIILGPYYYALHLNFKAVLYTRPASSQSTLNLHCAGCVHARLYNRRNSHARHTQSNFEYRKLK